jgi:hypothetical protein
MLKRPLKYSSKRQEERFRFSCLFYKPNFLQRRLVKVIIFKNILFLI